MSSKADVVVCFYRNELLWPFVVWGLVQNQDQIGTVIVSNDEAWVDSSRQAIEIVTREAKLTVPIKFVAHPRNGMRQAQSINDGVKAATSDYVLQIDDDVVLAPGGLASFLAVAEPGTLLTGRLHDIAREGVSTQYLDPPTILRHDKRLVAPSVGNDLVFSVRDSFLFYNTEDYRSMGGHDEMVHDGTENGYGFVDYVFALRWFKKFGLDSFEMTPAVAYHMSGLKPGHDFSKINQKYFEDAFSEFVLGDAHA